MVFFKKRQPRTRLAKEETGEYSAAAISRVLEKRKSLAREMAVDAASGAGLVSGGVFLGNILLPDKSKVILSTLAGAAAGAAYGAVRGAIFNRKEVGKLTSEVGMALSYEYQHGNNSLLRDAVNNYEFIFIDRAGRIVATNDGQKKLFGKKVLGRLRLECKKIKANEYFSTGAD